MDARPAKPFSLLQSCETGLLREVRHAAYLYGPDGVALTIGSFDNPEEIAPVIQWGTEAKLPYVDALPSLPREETMADLGSAPYLADLVSYQHPDHDTETWPPEDRS